MAPSRFRRDRARDVTPFRDSAPASTPANAATGAHPAHPAHPARPTTPGPTNQPNRPTTPGPNSQPSRPTAPTPTNQPNSDSSESRSTTPSPVSRPLTPGPSGPTSPVCVTPSPEKHPIWTSYDAPINFTWVIPEELCGMGWPKSRDQVRFLITQGIDHLVTLSPEKIPPVYAFPDLKHTSIPVEDFTGPTIAEIQKFIEIMDEARKDGEAVGVHCAEGRGRTGVMCACYLIYYHDMEPWDAIRIMRRQRPGSVERKIQEETVIKFWTLVQDYGKSSLAKLEEREKQLMEQQRRQQSELLRESDLVSQQMTMNLLGHMSSFYKQGPKVKAERSQRMRRAKSMTKIEDEEEKSIAHLKDHLASFFTGSGREGRQKRSKSQARDIKDSDGEAERRSRATTPGKGLIEEVKLKPVGESKPKNRLDPPPAAEEPCEYKNHFRDFMRTPAMNPRTPSTVKRGRSFSQPRDKDKDSGKEESLSRKESFEDKYVADRNEQENPLEKHSKRLFKIRNKSDIVAPNNTPNDSDSHYSSVLDKPVECDNRYRPSSEEDAEDKLTDNYPKSPPPNRYDYETDSTFYTRTRADTNTNTNTKTKRVPKSEKSETEKMAERREKRARNRTIAIGPSSSPYSKQINLNSHHNYNSNVLPDLTLINSNTNIIKLTPDLRNRDNRKTIKKDADFKNIDSTGKSTNLYMKQYSKSKQTEIEELDELETIIPEIETTQVMPISRRSSQELLNLIIKARGSRSRTTSECQEPNETCRTRQSSNEKRKSKIEELLKIPQKQYSRTSSREFYPRSRTSSEKCLYSRQNSQEQKDINQEKRSSRSDDFLSVNGSQENIHDRRSSKSEDSRILNDIAENGPLTDISVSSRRPSATPSETSSKRSSVKKAYSRNPSSDTLIYPYSRNPSSDAIIYDNSEISYVPTKSSVNHDRGSCKTAEMLAKKNEKRNAREDSITKSTKSMSNATEQRIYSVSEALLSRGINVQEKTGTKNEDPIPNGIKIHPATEELISKGLKIHPKTEEMITKGLNIHPKTEEETLKTDTSKEQLVLEAQEKNPTSETKEEKTASKSFVYEQDLKSSGLRRNTYRKTYSRQRSDPSTREVEKEKTPEAPRSKTQPVTLSKEKGDILSSSRYSASVKYTQSTTPHRPTTPGPYLGIDRPITPGPYSTSSVLSRDSWKRTNQKFSYAKFLNYSTRETYL